MESGVNKINEELIMKNEKLFIQQITTNNLITINNYKLQITNTITNTNTRIKAEG